MKWHFLPFEGVTKSETEALVITVSGRIVFFDYSLRSPLCLCRGKGSSSEPPKPPLPLSLWACITVLYSISTVVIKQLNLRQQQGWSDKGEMIKSRNKNCCKMPQVFYVSLFLYFRNNTHFTLHVKNKDMILSNR